MRSTDEKPDTDIVIFSKDRTLQLKSLLRSIGHYSDISEEEINVIYKSRPEIPYEPLTNEFGCNFVQQQSFLDDLSDIVEGSDREFVLFMVDDLIIRDHFSLRSTESFLRENRDVDCVSLRLGRNIRDGLEPEFTVRDEEFLVWDTGPKLGRTWNYFWELSSSMYRKEMVRKYLRMCDRRRVSFPNPLEFFYYSRMPSHLRGGRRFKRLLVSLRFLASNKTNRMACFETSRSMTQGVNLVAARNIDYRTLYEPETLHEKMEEGYIIDYRSLQSVINTKPNAGSEHFRLIKEDHGKTSVPQTTS